MQMNKEKFLKRFTNLGISVDAVIKKFPTSRYVGQFPLKARGGDMTDFAADVFYEPNPDVELGHSNYFAVYRTADGAFITNASHVETLILLVYADSDGDFIYARYQHDFRPFDDNYVDGGAWLDVPGAPGMKSMMGRLLGNVEPESQFSVVVKDGEFCILTA